MKKLNIKKKQDNKDINNNQFVIQKKKRVQYSLLTFVLIICIFELVISNMQNINKSINYKLKIKGLEQKKNEEVYRNKQLKSEIQNFNSATTLESIGRNNLKMAGKNEILIIMHKPDKDNIDENNSKVKVSNKKESQKAQKRPL